ncbi:MAG: PEP-CTERM sorting domain-containing protein [Kiritimatiellia bacterium]|jgi:hypothetical protein|nr:PEP-CTERM sorting domain-containing protein [Kiritimatiellia bacterium]MDP6848329.1 PEP-CTERM sorting domain-containing protein [Kiritimatiellia bacterium]
MLRKVMLALCGVLLVVATAGAGQITWGTFDLNGDPGLDSGSDTWLVILVQDSNADGIDDIWLSADLADLVFFDTGTMNPGDDADTGVSDALSFQPKTGLAWGTSFASTDGGTPGWGDSVYTIILNSDALATATQYLVMDSNPTQLPGDDSDGGYTFPEEAPYGSWQPLNVVPEPGTMGLMALGLAIVGLRRRKS